MSSVSIQQLPPPRYVPMTLDYYLPIGITVIIVSIAVIIILIIILLLVLRAYRYASTEIKTSILMFGLLCVMWMFSFIFLFSAAFSTLLLGTNKAPSEYIISINPYFGILMGFFGLFWNLSAAVMFIMGSHSYRGGINWVRDGIILGIAIIAGVIGFLPEARWGYLAIDPGAKLCSFTIGISTILYLLGFLWTGFPLLLRRKKEANPVRRRIFFRFALGLIMIVFASILFTTGFGAARTGPYAFRTPPIFSWIPISIGAILFAVGVGLLYFSFTRY